jgi:hypothetical protein
MPSGDSKKRVEKAQKAAMEMMKKAGFEVGNGIQVTVDQKLPFMGYSRPEGRRPATSRAVSHLQDEDRASLP